MHCKLGYIVLFSSLPLNCFIHLFCTCFVCYFKGTDFGKSEWGACNDFQTVTVPKPHIQLTFKLSSKINIYVDYNRSNSNMYMHGYYKDAGTMFEHVIIMESPACVVTAVALKPASLYICRERGKRISAVIKTCSR